MIPAERSHLHVAARTHPGISGKKNEDRYAVSAFRLGENHLLPVVFAIVSDGIGGHRAGEVAAEMVVEKISQAIADSDSITPIQTLREAIQNASQAVRVLSESDFKMAGMGATCACTWIIDDRLYIAYVGDSRIFHVRGNTILQLSRDHTWIQESLDAGILSPEKAKSHPNAHVIQRYLGSKKPVEPDTRLHLENGESEQKAESNQGMRLFPGDQIILCSDGLTDLVDEDEILATISHMDHEQALEKLISLANQRGGHDNITIVALKVPDTTFPATTAKTIPVTSSSSRRAKLLRQSCILALILFGATILTLGGYFLVKQVISTEPALTSPSIALPTQATTFPSMNPLSSATLLPIHTSPSPPPVIISTTSPVSPSLKTTLTAWPTNTHTP